MSSSEWQPIRGVPILTAEESRETWTRIQELRDRWDYRDTQSQTLGTLGAVAYMDCNPGTGGSYERYWQKAQETNPLLETHFGDLLGRVMAALHEHLGAPVRYQEGAARPGFHIWSVRAADQDRFETMVGHCDLFLSGIPWAGRVRADEGHYLSFTMPVVTPAVGSFLRIWKLHASDFPAGGSLQEAQSQVEWRLHQYATGRLDLHSGLWFHAMHRPMGHQDGEWRVMLQGHAYRRFGIWWVFW